MKNKAPFELLSMPETRPENAPDYFHVMAKPTGAICNLDCEYCFFLSKEALYPGSPFRMGDDVLEAYIKQIIESQNAPQVAIAWQGGEPTLMGLEFFQLAMELVEKYARPGVTIDNTIQTNGTKLDDDWCRFFKKHNFLVGLSMDGPKHMHDAYRVDKGGEGTFDQVMAAARLMQKYKVEFNILCTVHTANGDHPLEVYRFFRDEVKTDFIQFIPIIERATPELLSVANRGWGDQNLPSSDELESLPVAKSSKRPLYTLEGSLVTERSVTAEQWGAFLSAIFNEWVRNDVGKVYIQSFESALGSWVGRGASLCIHRSTCGDASPSTCWATSMKNICWSWRPLISSASSGTTSAISYRATVWSARCALPAMAAARATALSRHPMGSRASITYAPATRLSSRILTNPCA